MPRRFISSLCALSFLFGVIGLPVAMPRAESTSDEDYPCKGHQCGCVSAEACRTRCCCFHTAQRQPEEADSSCCSAKPRKVPVTSARKTGPSVELAINALGCRGIILFWMSAGGVCVAPSNIATIPAPALLADAIFEFASIPASKSLIPATPPPRTCA